MTTHQRRLDRIDHHYRELDPSAPWERTLATIKRAMTPADRATWDRIATTYAAPADSYANPDTAMDPADYEALTGVMARSMRALGVTVPEEKEAAAISEYQMRHMNGDQHDER